MPPDTPFDTSITDLSAQIGTEAGTIRIRVRGRDGNMTDRQVDLRRPLENLSEENLQTLLSASMADPGIRGFERLIVTNVALRQRQRLRQTINGAPQAEQLSSANWQTFAEYVPSHVVDYFRELRQYTILRDQLRAGGAAGSPYRNRYDIADTPQTTAFEERARQHIQALTATINPRVRLGNYAALIVMRRETTNAAEQARMDTAIAQARGQLPASILIRTPRARDNGVQLPQGVIRRADAIEIPMAVFQNAHTNEDQFIALQRTSQLLDAEISWLMSATQGVPGAATTNRGVTIFRDMLGIQVPAEGEALPSGLLNVDLLERAFRENTRRDIALRANPTLNAGTLRTLREDRMRMISEMTDMLHRLGGARIGGTRLLAVRHAFGDTFQGPADVPGRTPPDGDVQRYIQEALTHEMGQIRGHFREILQGGGTMSIRLPDIGEDIFNDQGRHAMLRMHESIVAIRESPRAAVRAGLRQIPLVGDIAENFVDSPDAARADIMRSVREAMGYPPDYDILTDRPPLTEAQRAEVQRRIESTRTIINLFRPRIQNAADTFNEHLDTLDALRTGADTNADSLLGVEPLARNRLQPFLVNGRVTRATITGIRTAADLTAEEKKAAFVACYLELFSQMETDWSAYVVTTREYLQELEGIFDMHGQMVAAWSETAQRAFDRFLPIVCMGGGALGALYLMGGRGGFARFTSSGRIGLTSPLTRIFNGPFSAADRAGGALWHRDARRLWNPTPDVAPITAEAAQAATLERTRALSQNFQTNRANHRLLLDCQRDPANIATLRSTNPTDPVLLEVAAGRMQPQQGIRMLEAERVQIQGLLMTEMDTGGDAARQAVAQQLSGRTAPLTTAEVSAILRAHARVNIPAEGLLENLCRTHRLDLRQILLASPSEINQMTGLSEALRAEVIQLKILRITQKSAILQAAGFNAAEIRIFMESGVTGAFPASAAAAPVLANAPSANPAAATRFGTLRRVAQTRRWLVGPRNAGTASRALHVGGRAFGAYEVGSAAVDMVDDVQELANAPRYRTELMQELEGLLVPLTQGANPRFRREGDRFISTRNPNGVIDLGAIRTGIPDRTLIIAKQLAGNTGRMVYALAMLASTEFLPLAAVGITWYAISTFGRPVLNTASLPEAQQYAAFLQDIPAELHGLIPTETLMGENPMETWNRFNVLYQNVGRGAPGDQHNEEGRGRMNGARERLAQALSARYLLANPLARTLLGGSDEAPWTQVRMRTEDLERNYSDSTEFQSAIERTIILSIRQRVFYRYAESQSRIAQHERATRALTTTEGPALDEVRSHILTPEELQLEREESEFWGSQLIDRSTVLWQLAEQINLRQVIDQGGYESPSRLRARLYDVWLHSVPESVKTVTGSFEEEMRLMERNIPSAGSRLVAENALEFLTAVGGVEVMTWLANGKRESAELTTPEGQREGISALRIRRGSTDIYVRMAGTRLVWSSWGSPAWQPIEGGRYAGTTLTVEQSFANSIADSLARMNREYNPAPRPTRALFNPNLSEETTDRSSLERAVGAVGSVVDTITNYVDGVIQRNSPRPRPAPASSPEVTASATVEPLDTRTSGVDFLRTAMDFEGNVRRQREEGARTAFSAPGLRYSPSFPGSEAPSIAGSRPDMELTEPGQGIMRIRIASKTVEYGMVGGAWMWRQPPGSADTRWYALTEYRFADAAGDAGRVQNTIASTLDQINRTGRADDSLVIYLDGGTLRARVNRVRNFIP